MSADTRGLYGLDGSDRMNEAVGELVFTIGPMPFGKGEELIGAWNRVDGPKWAYLCRVHAEWWRKTQELAKTDPDAPLVFPEDPELEIFDAKARVESLVIAVQILCWSVKGWRAAPPSTIAPLPMRQERIAGETYDVASRRHIELLAREDGGETVLRLAGRIVGIEKGSAREALSFFRSSGPATSPTNTVDSSGSAPASAIPPPEQS